MAKPLPVAKGRPTGRRCFVCRERKPVGAYRGTARRCTSCVEGERHRVFRRACKRCEESFTSASSRALYCDGCVE